MLFGHMHCISFCHHLHVLTGAGYSLWTNRSFKTPLLAAAVACIAGNVLYALGYDVKTLWILLASRLLVGFGKLCHLAIVQTLPCLPYSYVIKQPPVTSLESCTGMAFDLPCRVTLLSFATAMLQDQQGWSTDAT